ncbi:unnamed protein product [Nezara viridula]|uniref:Uncharacterized protein n=1 Tax=Nezara viridula TaxID=85310 RepID=A0A9P0H7C1_NEZVI|nr:unnamed protein product [Nezara viridula]
MFVCFVIIFKCKLLLLGIVTGEKVLKYFKFYTKTNCENECLINRTIDVCKCVDFYMPHFESTRICYTETDVECIVETMDWWERRGKKFCNCYPYCSEINYNAYIFGKNRSSTQSRDNEIKNFNVSIYNADEFYTSRENKQSQWTIIDLVASCGGVFGLLCGMSLIGVVEFIYYATIRVISNIIRIRREERRTAD